jgi:hypothetical protein
VGVANIGECHRHRGGVVAQFDQVQRVQLNRAGRQPLFDANVFEVALD